MEDVEIKFSIPELYAINRMVTNYESSVDGFTAMQFVILEKISAAINEAELKLISKENL